jgi:uncharacterized repeat protein (TIGR01451 family)
LPAETFESGSLIIPMDVTYQDIGGLRAFGLVHYLLLNHIPVHWIIDPDKTASISGITITLSSDFSVAAKDLETDAPIEPAHEYRGGPFVIDQADAAMAKIHIAQFWADHPIDGTHNVTAHETTASFEGTVERTLVVAPSIAVFADGNQKIARDYLEAAAIPDSTGDFTWPDSSPDMFNESEMAGATDINHLDGALFDEDGDPKYCQVMSMHWSTSDAEATPEVVAEVRSFLSHPVNFFAECQSVTSFENSLWGQFLTPNGFQTDNPSAGTLIGYSSPASPFAQIDGPFGLVAGPQMGYSPYGGVYKVDDVAIITQRDTPETVQDIWISGFFDGVCPPASKSCPSPNPWSGGLGRISYRGGHDSKTTVPLSSNPESMGTRLFLQSLFTASCATEIGQPSLEITKSGPATTSSDVVTWTISFTNNGPGMVLDAIISDTLPLGVVFISATSGGSETTGGSGTVTWDVGNVGVGESGSVDVVAQLPFEDTWDNFATVSYRVGLNNFEMDSEIFSTTLNYLFEEEIFSDGFESGDTTLWSNTVP